MNVLVRQVAVLSVLWSLCELLLPDGRRHQMVRMTVSVLVMTALLGTAGQMLSSQAQWPAWAQQSTCAANYEKTALRALANQAQAYCERTAQRAGYAAEAAVWLRMDGGVERIELTLKADTPLMTQAELAALLSAQLGVAEERICLLDVDSGMGKAR